MILRQFIFIKSLETAKLYCSCRQPDDPRLDWIKCDSGVGCAIGWFHIKCVGIAKLTTQIKKSNSY